MNIKYYIFLISVAICLDTYCQTISIHSVTWQRQLNAGGGGYTLDGTNMNVGGRLKLLTPSNFGISGIYSKSVNISDGFSASNSVTQVVNFPYNDLFFFGVFDKSDNTLVQFTNAEIDSLYNWSKRGGKLIIGGSPSVDNYDLSILNSKWGFQITQFTPPFAYQGNIAFYPNSVGLTTDIFNGPFGSVNSASQAGSAQGYFSTLPSNVSILATDANNNPTIIMDCTTLDLIVADVDGYTSDPGAVTAGSTITNDQDKYFVNTFVFMDKLQPLPQLTNDFNTLALNASYNNYQWYLNNSALNGAVNSSYTASDTGHYYVEVTLNGGCKVKSNILNLDTLDIIPNIFTPNNDGINDLFTITTKNIRTLNCKIYNRWGILVGELKTINEVWDGFTTSGQKCTEGVYYWVVEYQNSTGTNKLMKGFVQLLR